MLRAPGFLHWKDKDDPYLVQEVWRTDAEFSGIQMLSAFPVSKPKVQGAGPLSVSADGFWARVSAFPVGEAILRLNGSWGMGGEIFRLEEQSSGTANIVREDGHSTGCWIRADGSLGGCEYGPTIAAWCYWYLRDWSLVAKAIKERFPEVCNE